jgi:hypothetical protein
LGDAAGRKTILTCIYFENLFCSEKFQILHDRFLILCRIKFVKIGKVGATKGLYEKSLNVANTNQVNDVVHGPWTG